MERLLLRVIGIGKFEEVLDLLALRLRHIRTTKLRMTYAPQENCLAIHGQREGEQLLLACSCGAHNGALYFPPPPLAPL